MKCPHCGVGIYVDWSNTFAYVEDAGDEEPEYGQEIIHYQCPECKGIIIKLIEGPVEFLSGSYHVFIDDLRQEETIYPVSNSRQVEEEVPEKYRKDFKEACSVLSLSPKASAAISRRILQSILREEFKIKSKDLAREIDSFLELEGIPSHLSGAVDAIRNIGNFAAHPLKETHTGEILDVEPGEAEWLLDVLESLFDFTFVQPIRLKSKKDLLNKKLKALGKPPMKG